MTVQISQRPIALCIATLAAAAAATAAHAADVHISVSDSAGQPVANAVVMIDVSASSAAPPALAATGSGKDTVVDQRRLQFVPFLTVVAREGSVRFLNSDDFDHHVHGSSPRQNFQFRIDAADSKPKSKSGKPAKPATVRLTHAGPIALSCHLHGSMRGHLYVSDSPYFAKTDGNGHATITGVPEGAARVRSWHPYQLVEQASVPLAVQGQLTSTHLRLNFMPRASRAD